MKDLVRRLAEERGVDLRGYKATTLERRVRRRMQQLGAHTYEEYLQHIGRDQSETVKLLDTVLFSRPAGMGLTGGACSAGHVQGSTAGKLFSGMVRGLRQR